MHQDKQFVGIGMPGADSAGFVDYEGLRPAQEPGWEQSRELLKGQIIAKLPKAEVILPMVTVNGAEAPNMDPIQGSRARATARVQDERAELAALADAGLLNASDVKEYQERIEKAAQASEVLSFAEVSQMEAERAALKTTEIGRAKLALPNLQIREVKMEDGTVATVVLDAHAPDVKATMETIAEGVNVQLDQLRSTQRDKIQSYIDSNHLAMDNIDVVLEGIELDRSVAGQVGGLRGVFQEVVSMTKDLDEVIPGNTLTNVINSTMRLFGSDVAIDDTNNDKDEFGEWFDPTLARNTMFERSLAYRLARARKGYKRLNIQDVKLALKDTQITGLISVDKVKARLQYIRTEFEKSNAKLRDRKEYKREEIIPEYEFEGGALVPSGGT